uniref:GPI ethanolamine phosphate transferase 1 n=1 Tax=Oryza sativa subsp. japonica TaxID=39947 RepID=Q6EUN5_ORYSJ|nr:putative phosphatidylinositolglycan class N short form [Oryza sativa Japonica Group]
MAPEPPRFSAPPAKRLVLLVGASPLYSSPTIADGLRADKFFEPDERGRYRAPFLRGVIEEKGRWGVSHARPPTESRPGHVAIIAGFYEDPSAVTKGWKANPVEFDSVFNQSRHIISFGSPDIVPIFCSSLPHSTWGTYPHEYEDFATGLLWNLVFTCSETLIADASFLDHWSFDQFQGLLNRSFEDAKLRQLLLQDKLVIFLHLLGCDTNGHAHRPYSNIYLNNVKVVDQIAESMYNLMESYFNDNQTAYVFTADHGMSDKGSHGDGHPSNTDTPLVAWGAGIRSPKFLAYTDKPDDGFRFVDDHKHDMPTPQDWALEGFERVDVNQADISPLMATLVGLPCPLNSVGSLPTHYLKLSKADEVEAVLANTKQILNQFLRKSQMKQSSSLYFKPFKPLANYSLVLDQIEDLISAKDYENAMKHSEELRSMALAGLHYFQTYDWFMLMTTITLGYIGWMVNLILHVLQSYTSFPANLQKRTQVYAKNTSVKAVWRELSNMPFKYTMNLLNISVIALFILEFLVMSFFDRKLYTWCFLILGILASSCEKCRQFFLDVGICFVEVIFWNNVDCCYNALGCICCDIFYNGVDIDLAPVSEQTAAPIAPDDQLVNSCYEAVFYSAFAMVLMGWIFVESANLYCSEQNGSARRSSIVEGSIFGYDERCLQLSDLRIPLLFTILFNVAFFGTGNFASIASFEISSVYRFITIFSVFFSIILLLIVFHPLSLAAVPDGSTSYLQIVHSIYACHVRNTGSWMEIGNSISHFGIVSAQVVFVLLLFALTNIFTKDIEVSSRQLSSRKVM